MRRLLRRQQELVLLGDLGFRFMEKAGERWWSIAGAIYVVRAVKRVTGMRLVQPSWRESAMKRPSLVQVARRDNVIHVRPLQNRRQDLP